jgi:hypothetical protein
MRRNNVRTMLTYCISIPHYSAYGIMHLGFFRTVTVFCSFFGVRFYVAPSQLRSYSDFSALLVEEDL